MLPSINTINAPTSDEVKEVTMGMKNNDAAGTEHLQVQSFKYGGNEIEKVTEIVTKVSEGEGRP
jgi:formyltetrahydrofolate synthetase